MFSGVDASLNKLGLKKVASAYAAFFVSKLLQDGLNQAEHEHQPFVVIHDVTPSHARGKPTHQLPRQILSRVQEYFKQKWTS